MWSRAEDCDRPENQPLPARKLKNGAPRSACTFTVEEESSKHRWLTSLRSGQWESQKARLKGIPTLAEMRFAAGALFPSARGDSGRRDRNAVLRLLAIADKGRVRL